ncbi:MAG: metallophosphoesterase [Acidimicrobiaceae bacterium]|nr:metallophosphoesterase [Acidimicrobiaceae bacterium]
MAAYLLVQVSDVHLTSGGATVAAGARPRQNLVAALQLLERSQIRPDLLVLTGDLTDAGEASCYQDLAAMVTAAATALGCEVLYLPGNHDDRDSFRRLLLGDPGGSGPINQVRWQGGLRVIALDSTIPGEGVGNLDDETLAFLADALAAPAPDGTVLAMHHPPIPSPVLPMSRLRLGNAAALAEVVQGRDVRVILCGHNHHLAAGQLGDVPVWVSPATAYLVDVTSPAAAREIPGSAVSRIDLDSDGYRASVITVPIG